MTPKEYADYLLSSLNNLQIHDVYIDELYSGETQIAILKEHIRKQAALFIIQEIKKVVTGQEIEWYDAVEKVIKARA